MSIIRSQPPDKLDSSSIDNEHRIQTGLLDALYDAVNSKKPAAEINQILNQLISYSELHFMSEELLMRLYTYPDYDDHVSDHEAITEYLNTIEKTLTAGQDSMALETATDMRQFLVSHISSRDEAFSEFLNKAQA
jgi:hemerythrin